MKRTFFLTVLAGLVAAGVLAGLAVQRPGFDDTPVLPGQKWRVHDAQRPHPHPVTPGTESTQERAGRAPSDAVALFDGKDLSRWVSVRDGKVLPPKWKVADGYMEVAAGTGDLVSKEKFGDAQIHVEWAAPNPPVGTDQMRGNSGVLIMKNYEIQILDNYDAPTYADGSAASIYGQFPPLVRAVRKPGEWQTYDIAFEAPKFENNKVIKPAFVTVFHNGVLVHHHQAILGHVQYRQVAYYVPHAPEEPLLLQDHGCAVRYRNVWVRRIAGYDRPEAK